MDRDSVATTQADLEAPPVTKRDLALRKTLDVSRGFTESRSTKNLLAGESHFIEDITSTEVQLVDELPKVKGVLEELMKATYQNSGVYAQLINVFMGWHKYDHEEKLKQLNKHLCNELNIFVYFKDRDFFDSTLKPFLQCKMEKRFVDYYLLS